MKMHFLYFILCIFLFCKIPYLCEKNKRLSGLGKINLCQSSLILILSIFHLNMTGETVRSNANTIVKGFVGGGSSNLFRWKYVREVFVANVISHSFPTYERGERGLTSSFSNKDVNGINHHDNDPVVINVQHGNYDIK